MQSENFSRNSKYPKLPEYNPATFGMIPPPPPQYTRMPLPPNVIPLRQVSAMRDIQTRPVNPAPPNLFPMVPPPPSTPPPPSFYSPHINRIPGLSRKTIPSAVPSPSQIRRLNRAPLTKSMQPFLQKTNLTQNTKSINKPIEFRPLTRQRTVIKTKKVLLPPQRIEIVSKMYREKALKNIGQNQDIKKDIKDKQNRLISLTEKNPMEEMKLTTNPTPYNQNQTTVKEYEKHSVNEYLKEINQKGNSEEIKCKHSEEQKKEGFEDPIKFMKEDEFPQKIKTSYLAPNIESLTEAETSKEKGIESGMLLRQRQYPYKDPRVGEQYQIPSESIPKAVAFDEEAGGLEVVKGNKVIGDVMREVISATKDKIKKRLGQQENLVTGKILWRADAINKDIVSGYLDKIKNLFPRKVLDFKVMDNIHRVDYNSGYCIQRALYLLHKCHYDVKKALSMAKLENYGNTMNYEMDYDTMLLEQENLDEDVCFVCGDGGNLLLCDFSTCKKVYHAACSKIDKIPDGEWHCPLHFCDVCKLESSPGFACSYCPTAYCEKHVPPSLLEKTRVEFLCTACHKKCSDPRVRFDIRLMATLRRKNEFPRRYRIGGRELDYFDFYSAVISYGGAKRVTDSMKWSRVRKILGIPESSTNASSLLKSIYVRMLLPYETLYYGMSLPLDSSVKARRGRPRTKKVQMVDLVSNETCDIIVIGYQKHALLIEANLDGNIKRGFLFFPQIIEKVNKIKNAETAKRSVSAVSKPSFEPINESKQTEIKPEADFEFLKAVEKLLDDISINGEMTNPDFELALKARFALKKAVMSHQALAKIIHIPKEELNLLFKGTTKSRCPESIRIRVEGWLNGLPESVLESVSSAVENFKFREMAKLENLKLKRRLAGEGEEGLHLLSQAPHEEEVGKKPRLM